MDVRVITFTEGGALVGRPHVEGGWDDVLGFGGEASGPVLGDDGAGAEEEVSGGGGWEDRSTGCEGGGVGEEEVRVITTGAAVRSGRKASFLFMLISHSNHFGCSLTMSLESTTVSCRELR